MQRVRIPGGRAEPRQWRALADIARRLTPNTPLHLTTRQDIELHDLSAEDVPPVQSALDDAGLTSVGACGDTLRNITLCPGAGLCAGSVDVAPAARAVHQALAGLEGLFAMGRKFKISLSGCGRGCARPWINDLAFVATDGAFEVIGAGSLGAKPGAGIGLFERVEASHAPALAVAAVKLFMALGDRANRARARLRHVRERLGDEEFLSLLREGFESEKAARDWPDIELPPAGAAGEQQALIFADGDVTADAAEALGGIQDRPGLEVRIDVSHRVVVYGPAEQVSRLASEHPALAAAAAEGAAIIACPGTHWCSRGLVDTRELAGRIRTELGDRLAGRTVCISGCPNNCVHSAVADIGLVGRVGTANGKRQQLFDLFVDGGEGRTDRLAERIAGRMTRNEAINAVARHLKKSAPAADGSA